MKNKKNKIGIIFILSLLFVLTFSITVFAGTWLSNDEPTITHKYYVKYIVDSNDDSIFNINDSVDSTNIEEWDNDNIIVKADIDNRYNFVNKTTLATSSVTDYLKNYNTSRPAWYDYGETNSYYMAFTQSLHNVQIVSSNIKVLNNDNSIKYEPEPSIDDITNYNFDNSMIRFLKPNKNETLNVNRYTFFINGTLKHVPITLGLNGMNMADIKSDVEGYITKHRIIKIDSNVVTCPCTAYVKKFYNVTVEGLEQHYCDYDIQIQFTADLVDGSHSVEFKSNFLTKNPYGFIGFYHYEDIELSCTQTFIVAIDSTNPQNNKYNPNSSGGPPNRENYPEGIQGDIEYTKDLILYYIQMPFKLINSVFDFMVQQFQNLESWVGNASQFIKLVLGFLPYPLPELVVLSFTVGILAFVISIFKR